MSKTIVAIATPLAPAGLGVARISGDQALAVAGRVFRPVSSEKRLADAPGYAAMYGHVFDAQGDIDECVALVFRAPHSYTGEDTVELSCHGGLYLLRRTLRALLDAGAEPAGPGEFTRRAFVNGKVDLTGAEAVADLIAADGRLAAQTALAAREGAVYRRMQQVKESLLAVRSQMAAFVDYPDDDIPELAPETLEITLCGALSSLDELLANFDAGRVLREGIDTVIAGSPNVGKSTLMNRLAGWERSIVTPVAGTTRDVVEETVRLGEITLRLSDTAGIRETGDLVEELGVQKARGRVDAAALVLAVFDGSRPLDRDDRELAERLRDRTAIALLNKCDRPPAADRDWLAARFGAVIPLSALTGEGIDALERAVSELTGVARLSGSEPLLANERQRRCAKDARGALAEALGALRGGMTLDAVETGVDAALSALLALTGERATEAVVDEVFARFCVGK